MSISEYTANVPEALAVYLKGPPAPEGVKRTNRVFKAAAELRARMSASCSTDGTLEATMTLTSGTKLRIVIDRQGNISGNSDS